MGTICVNTAVLGEQAHQLSTLMKQIDAISRDVDNVKKNLQWNVAISNQVRSKISSYSNYINTLGSQTGALATMLSSVSIQYQKTESGLSKSSSVNPKTLNSGTTDGSTVSYVLPAASANAGWLGYEFDEDNPGVTAWIGKADAEIKTEDVYADVNAYLGKAEAKAESKVGFMQVEIKKEYKNGEWTEKEKLAFLTTEASAGASVAAFAADAKADVGSDMLGVEGKAEGTIGSAKAEVKGKFSVGEDGINANVKGEAMVSAVEGKVSGTINILGIEITGKAGAYAGALGVEGKAGIENNKLVLEGGVAALFGLSAGVEVGFNEEGWDNFVDFITFWD